MNKRAFQKHKESFERESFLELLHRKFPTGIEGIPKMLEISSHWFTKVKNGKHTHIDSEEIQKWAELLEEEEAHLISAYGVGKSVLTIDDCDYFYSKAGSSFSLPPALPHAA